MCTATVSPLPHQTNIKTYEQDNMVGYTESPYSEIAFSINARKWRTSFNPNDFASFIALSPQYGSFHRLLATQGFNDYIPNQSVDVISRLPVEISLLILSYLSPQNLCQVCRVCKKWYSLAEDRSLRDKRISYVKAKRLEYQQSKENYTRGLYVTSHSPPQRHSSLPILSPVNFKDTPRPKAETHRSATPSPLSSPSYYTPGSSFSSMIKRVEKLSINSSNYDICRRLFPDLSIPKKPSPTASRVVEGRGGPAYADVLIGRKHNKSRLRRL
jgi:hypothetical protein